MSDSNPQPAPLTVWLHVFLFSGLGPLFSSSAHLTVLLLDGLWVTSLGAGFRRRPWRDWPAQPISKRLWGLPPRIQAPYLLA